MKKIVKYLVVGLLVAGLVVVGIRAVKKKRAEEAAMKPAKSYAVVVSTMTPKWERVRLTLPYIATVKSDNDAVVSSKLAARVLFVHKAGARVEAGEPVIRLDKRDLEAKAASIKSRIGAAKASLSAAQTALKALEAAHARTQRLMAVKGASQEQFDAEVAKIAETRAKIAAARSQIDTLKANLQEVAQLLDYAIIKAPVSGVVGQAFVHPGDMAMPGKPLLAIRAKAGDYLSVALPPETPAKALLFNGKRYALHPLHATERGLALYRTEPLNRGMLSGERVEVRLVTFEGEGVLLPLDALLDREGSTTLFFVEGRHARPHRLEVAARGEEGIVTPDRAVADKKVAVAKPDVLLKLLGGVEVVAKGGER
jgi:multidrug efflux pump subunit AcrA (membrane-fusion protein)